MSSEKKQVKFNVDSYILDFNEYCLQNEEYKSYHEKAMKCFHTLMKLNILLDFVEDCKNEELYKKFKTRKEELDTSYREWTEKQNEKRKELKIEYCKSCYETFDW